MVARLFSPYMISHIDNAGTYRRKEQERQVLHDFLGPVAVMDVLRGAEPKHKSGARFRAIGSQAFFTKQALSPMAMPSTLQSIS